MGLLGLLKRLLGDEPAPPPKKGRGPGKTAAEKKILADIAERKWLQENDPAAYAQSVKIRQGVVRVEKTLIEQAKELKEIQGLVGGITGKGKSGSDFDALIENMPGIMKAAGPAIVALATGQPIQQPNEQHVPQLEAPKPKRRKARENPDVVDDAESVEEESEEAPVPFVIPPEVIVSIAKANMQGKPPREAAAFLLSQESKHEAVRDMIKVIVDTPDAKLLATLHAHATAPDVPPVITDLMAWFEGQPQWTLEIAKYIRIAKRPASARGKLRAL